MAKMEWSNVLRKSQYDDNTDNYIDLAYSIPGKSFVYFNVQEKRDMILTDRSCCHRAVDRNLPIELDKGMIYAKACQTDWRRAGNSLPVPWVYLFCKN